MYVSLLICLSTSLHIQTDCLPLYLHVCLCVCLSIYSYQSICLPVYLSVCLCVCLSVYLSSCQSICVHGYLYVCLSVYIFRLTFSVSICLFFRPPTACLYIYLFASLSVCRSCYRYVSIVSLLLSPSGVDCQSSNQYYGKKASRHVRSIEHCQLELCYCRLNSSQP